MIINFQCDCGRSLRVDTESDPHRVKCADCGAEFLIGVPPSPPPGLPPSPEATADKLAGKPAAVAAEPGRPEAALPIDFVCECGQMLHAVSGAGDQHVRCGACGAEFLIHAPPSPPPEPARVPLAACPPVLPEGQPASGTPVAAALFAAEFGLPAAPSSPFSALMEEPPDGPAPAEPAAPAAAVAEPAPAVEDLSPADILRLVIESAPPLPPEAAEKVGTDSVTVARPPSGVQNGQKDAQPGAAVPQEAPPPATEAPAPEGFLTFLGDEPRPSELQPDLPDEAYVSQPCGLAIAALVLGVMPCTFVPGIAAVVCGRMALAKIDASQGRLAGRGMAKLGMVLGGAMAVLNIAIGIYIVLKGR